MSEHAWVSRDIACVQKSRGLEREWRADQTQSGSGYEIGPEASDLYPLQGPKSNRRIAPRTKYPTELLSQNSSGGKMPLCYNNFISDKSSQFGK